MSADLKKRLPTIRTLAAMKMEKNFIALEKGYDRQPYASEKGHMAFWIKRLRQETDELEEATLKDGEEGSFTAMLEELADISNIIDYMAERLILKEDVFLRHSNWHSER